MQEAYTRSRSVIAVVDDDESVRTAVESLLRASGYSVRTYADAFAFLQSAGPGETHCLISDIQMPGMCGVQMHEALVARGVHIPIIFITGYPGELPVVSAGAQDLIACLAKPFQADQLMDFIELALARHA
ncbi:response regulator transcription factor [Pseudomonas sp.]|uniref:response regulator transcription factor n=2 Tax=unclassified Pseudomonas TaxID=196821 RepID=UPI003D124676